MKLFYGYELLTMANKGELEPKTIVKTPHERQYADDWKDYDYYIYHNDNMFHRCNKDGKLGSKYQDRFLNYKVLQKTFEIEEPIEEDEYEPFTEDKKIEKINIGKKHPAHRIKKIEKKLNELIDEVNKLKEDK